VIARAIVDQSKHHYLSLDSQYNSTQAKIRQLEEQLRKTRITAPISGRIAKVFMNQGEILAQGMPLVTLENMEEVLVELELSDRDMVKIQKGQPVEASTDAFGGKVFLGVVEGIASAANPVTRTFKVEARIGNRDRSLRSGMIASLRIILEKNRGLAIPTEALMDRRGDEADVFVVAGGKAHKVTVQLGGVLDREVEVISGLAEGDNIIVYGKEQVRDGQPIESYQTQ
jgi:RND family efflux transporter MFP subunit